MAFLGIKIPVQTARLLADLDVPGKRAGVHEMHITILMFEDNWAIEKVADALEAAYDIVAKTEPFTIKTKKVSSFPPKEGKPHPVIAIVESKELHELSKKLRRKFNKEDIEFDKTFKDYNPHITLAYADEAIKDFKIDAVEMVVQELVLFGGDHGDSRICVTFPLKSPEKHGTLLRKCEVFEKLANAQEELDKAMFEEQYRNDMLDAGNGTPAEQYSFIFTYKDLLKEERINDFWKIISDAEMSYRREDARLFPQWVTSLGTIDPSFATKAKDKYIANTIWRLQNNKLSTNAHKRAIWDLNDWQDFFTHEQMRDVLKMLVEMEQKDNNESGLADDLEMLALHNDKVDKKLVWRLLRQIDPKSFAKYQPVPLAFDKEKYTIDDVIRVIEGGQIKYEDLERVATRALPAAQQILRRVIWWWAGLGIVPRFIFDENMKPLGLDGRGDQISMKIAPDEWVNKSQNIWTSADKPSEWETLMKDYQIIPYPKTFHHIDSIERAASVMMKNRMLLQRCEVFEKLAQSGQD